MNKRKIVKGLLFAVFATCCIFGGSFFKVEKASADILPERKNLQSTEAYHTVTFVVDGEVYALFEYVEDGTPLGEAMLEDIQLSGYDFLGWTDSEGKPFTKETPILFDMTVTAILQERPYTEDELTDYAIVQNVDFGAQISLTHTVDDYGNYPINTGNSTSSLVYKFEYVDKGDGAVYLSLRDGLDCFGEKGYTFLFDGKRVETPVGAITLDEEDNYQIELGAIDAVGGGKTYIFVKVNGEIKVEGRVHTKLTCGSVLGVWGNSGATSAFLQVNAYTVGGNHYETLHEAYAYAEGKEIVMIRDVEIISVKEGMPILNLNGNSAGDIRIEGGALTLYGGTLTGSIALGEGKLQIKGGSFYEDVSDYLADGYHCIRTEDIYSVGKHEKAAVKGCAATCKETGLTDGEECGICGEVLLSQEPIEALGHQTQALEEIPATCEDVGYTAGEKCIREGCGEIVGGRELIPATGHVESLDEAVPSTCQTQGKTEGIHCSVCGEILKAQESTPLAAHCYQDGECQYCGKTQPEENDDESASASSFQSSSEKGDEYSSFQSESEGEGQAKGCAGAVSLSFDGWAFAIALALYFRRKNKH